MRGADCLPAGHPLHRIENRFSVPSAGLAFCVLLFVIVVVGAELHILLLFRPSTDVHLALDLSSVP
ncbi:hypothetical protein CUJ84_pRLN2000119 (plasmid) [Rhizobium leguminosarum]|uniref:Uncharacterized protein n=1 Tax=Rhizobium leguminosarum TaxID=384 RepID=A0A2K9ZEI0_RHILE|nr:hypothetical protein CUJ84_pRLN2000119 [Rhizobium leguminosarum]